MKKILLSIMFIFITFDFAIAKDMSISKIKKLKNLTSTINEGNASTDIYISRGKLYVEKKRI